MPFLLLILTFSPDKMKLHTNRFCCLRVSLVNWLNPRLARRTSFTDFPFLRDEHIARKSVPAAHGKLRWKMREQKIDGWENRARAWEINKFSCAKVVLDIALLLWWARKLPCLKVIDEAGNWRCERKANFMSKELKFEVVTREKGFAARAVHVCFGSSNGKGISS